MVLGDLELEVHPAFGGVGDAELAEAEGEFGIPNGTARVRLMLSYMRTEQSTGASHRMFMLGCDRGSWVFRGRAGNVTAARDPTRP